MTRRRPPCQDPCKGTSSSLLLLTLLVLLLSCQPASGKMKTLYKSKKQQRITALNTCIRDIRNLQKQAQTMDNAGSCLSCDPTLGVCPVDCQPLLDAFFGSCRGMTLPDGFYFDPPAKTMPGTWTSDYEYKLKIGAARCGCNSGSTLTVSLLGLLLPALTTAWLLLSL